MRLRLPRPARGFLLVALGFVLGAAVLLLIVALAIGTPVERVALPSAVPPPGSPDFLRLVELHGHVPLLPGGSAALALDAAGTFPRLWADIGAARETVHVQLYYCKPGAIADTLASVLRERARAGVAVRFLYDAFGCGPLGEEFFRELRAGGVDVRPLRPVRWWSLHKAQERSHARIVVVDGRVGWTGGFGIDDRWGPNGADGEPGWRETNVRFTGPAVAQLQAAFADGWAEAAGVLLVLPHLYGGLGTGTPARPDPAAPEAMPGAEGGARMGLLHSVPDLGSTTAERVLALTLTGARRTLYIANAYFVPDDDFRDMLILAARRGVDVRILTPDRQTDVPIVRYAARAHYPELLAGGVRIWEYRPSMMHAKTFVADGRWTGIGSMNFDNRSIAVNDETTLLVDDPRLGATMDALFLRDLERATELTPETFGRRGFWERGKERLAVLASRVL